ncbi:MAG: DUF3786 domain-containing protein [Desulfosalsimonas sp.]
MTSSQKELFRWADQIQEASWTDLCNRSPQQAAEAVGAVWDGKFFKVPLLGVEYRIDPANQRINVADNADHPVSYQAGIVLLTTLSVSKGVPPSGRMTVPQELPGGRMFFTGAHDVANKPLAKRFEKASDQLVNRALEIGGEMIEGADIAICLPGLPYVPLYILYWRGDQEVPARAVIGIDDRAYFHLDLAGVFALTNILVFEFCRVD